MIRVIDDGTRDDSRRCAAGVRAARDVEAAHGRRSALDRDARVSRRGAAFDRRGLAAAAANARGRGRRGNAGRICGRKTRRRESGGTAFGDDDQRGRSFLLRAGAAQFPEVGDDGTRAHRFARHALRARASRQAIRAEDADAGNHSRDGGRDDGRARLPAFRAAGARRAVRTFAGSLAHARGDHRGGTHERRARRGTRRARVRFAARSAARQPQRHLRFREQAPGARPPDPARDSRGLPQRAAARGFSGGAAVSRFARRGSGRERSPGENRGAFPASAIRARLHARFDPPGAFARAADSELRRRRAGRRGRRRAGKRRCSRRRRCRRKPIEHGVAARRHSADGRASDERIAERR